MSGFNNRPPVTQNIANNITENFSGILSTRPSAKYVSGARCLLKVNSRLVGFAFGISWRITTDYVEINTIDNTLTDELIPRRTTATGTISALHIPGENPVSLKWQPDLESFLFHRYITIEVRDSTTDQLLFFTDKAVITDQVEDVRVDQLSSVTLNWKAITWTVEKTPEKPGDLKDGENYKEKADRNA